MPSAARRPMRTTVRRSAPAGANSSTRCSSRRACRARVAPSDSGMPSGTSTIDSAVSEPPGASSAAPMRTRSAAVRGLASGMRIARQRRARAHRRGDALPSVGGGALAPATAASPALDELRLGQLEGACLALHERLGLLGGHLAGLDDEAGDPPEVERHQRRHERARWARPRSGGHGDVVDERAHVSSGKPKSRPRPRVGGIGARRLASTARGGLVGEPRAPAHRRGVERRLAMSRRRSTRPPANCVEQAARVDLERRRVDEPLEAVDGHVVRAVDLEPASACASVSRSSVPTTWLNIGPRSAPGSLGSWTLAPSRVWHTAKPPVMAVVVIQMSMPNLADIGRPVVLREVVADEVAADPEVAADGLADAQAVERAGERIGHGVGDGAVPLVAAVERRDEVEAALEDGPGEQLDPLGHDRAQVRVDDHQRLDAELVGDLEDGAQRRALAADAVHLGVGQADALEPVARPDEQDPLDVVGRLGVHDHDALRAIGRAGVGVDEHGAQVGEVLHQPGLRGAHHVADRGGVPVARDADHDVGLAESLDLVPDGCWECPVGHRPNPNRVGVVRRPGALLHGRARAATIGPMTAVAQSSASLVTAPYVLRRARLGIMLAFLANGATFGTWATRIPEIRDHLGLSDSMLGFALLSIAVGAVLAMPIAGTMIGRFSSRHMVLLGTLLMSIGLVTAGFAPSLLVLVPGLACLGMGSGWQDVAMNAHGVEVERRVGKPILSGFHALFSVGGMLGAAIGGAVVGAAIAVDLHFAVSAIFIAAIGVVAWALLMPGRVDPPVVRPAAQPPAARGPRPRAARLWLPDGRGVGQRLERGADARVAGRFGGDSRVRLRVVFAAHDRRPLRR